MTRKTSSFEGFIESKKKIMLRVAKNIFLVSVNFKVLLKQSDMEGKNKTKQKKLNRQ